MINIFERENQYLRIYGNIIANIVILDFSKGKDEKLYNESRGKLWDLLFALDLYYPKVADELERNPVHFQPSKLMSRVVNR